jgi:hypothetical protein
MMHHPSMAVNVRGSGEHPRAAKAASARVSTVERVRARIASLGCDRVWARGAGSQVLIGLRGEEAYARLTPVRESLFGLAFRDDETSNQCGPREGDAEQADVPASGPGWQPLLLIDALEDLVEHALVAVDALPDPLHA